MDLNAHLSFGGECEAAFRFYESCLGGKITFLLRYQDSPMAGEVPAEFGGKILHATLALGEQRLTGADRPGPSPSKEGISLVVNSDSVEEAERIFNRLTENGRIEMPLEETFWASRFGMLVDQFGTAWMINCQRAS